MFGYVTPIKEQMSVADFTLYRAYYCGICKATGKIFGQLPRFTTNYDIVFLSLLMHDFTETEISFETGKCILNPLKKKATVIRTDLLDKLINTNIILSFYKTEDAVRDKEGVKKRALKMVLKKHYNKAAQQYPEINLIVKTQYEKLFKMEQENFSGIDRISDCFASMLRQIAGGLLGDKADDNILRLCYNIGKFVYIADALDDIAEDFKKKRYNPFLAVHPQFNGKKEFVKTHYDELTFVFASTINRAIESFNQIVFTQSYDLLKNIVHTGLRQKADELLAGDKKLKKPRL